MQVKLRNRFRRRAGGDSNHADRSDERASLPPGMVGALPSAADDVIDVRDGALDGGMVPIAVLADTLAVDLVANGHEPGANGDETAALPEVVDAESHIEATAALTAELIAGFAARTQALHEQVDAAQQRSSAALHRATALSEALVAAAHARAAEAREASARQHLDANERLGVAIELLDRARAQADELIELAHRAAAQIIAAASVDREAAERALFDVEQERDELVAGARETMRVATEDLKDRLEDLDGQLQAHASALLRSAGAERNRPAPVDEIDRRLALAVERALSEV